MPAHQRLRLEDNRGFKQGGEQPIKPDEDHAICRAQPEPRRRGSLQHNKLMPEKCRLGFASRMRSEHSDEQSAEQLHEVDHPKERIAHRDICASPDAIFGSHRCAYWCILTTGSSRTRPSCSGPAHGEAGQFMRCGCWTISSSNISPT